MTTVHDGAPSERNYRRTVFDAVTDNYDRGRPGYPSALFSDIAEQAQLNSSSRILEIGPGTGHATLPFARQGYAIEAYELGENLAQKWQTNLTDYPNATITVGPFESARLATGAFDLAFAATAFHWIDPSVGYQKVHDALRPGAWFALWWNRYRAIAEDAAFSEMATPIYQRLAPDLIEADLDPPVSNEVIPPTGNQIIQSNLFGPVSERRYEWQQTFPTDEFLALLDSFSRYQLLEPEVRRQLFEELATGINTRLNGQVTKGFLTFLYLTQRVDAE
jgi:SAM-dependent methyltransferase